MVAFGNNGADLVHLRKRPTELRLRRRFHQGDSCLLRSALRSRFTSSIPNTRSLTKLISPVVQRRKSKNLPREPLSNALNTLLIISTELTGCNTALIPNKK